MKKKVLWVGIIIVCIFLVMGVKYYSDYKSYESIISSMEIRDIQIENIEDGAYTGGFDAKLVSAKVRVTVENGQVTDIQLLEHENGQGAAAEVIVETVIQEQSLMVDAVSGATSSSHVILKAIENALNNPI